MSRWIAIAALVLVGTALTEARFRWDPQSGAFVF
jgi:hypothetical protein